SPPSLSEVRTNEGSINLNLQPEDGLCFDIGARGSFFSKKLFIMGSFFVYRLKDAITTFTNVQGVVLFRNSGNITQRGFESEFAYDIIRSHSGAIRNLSLKGSYTGHFFHFKNYQQNQNDFSGNQLTGVAPNI